MPDVALIPGSAHPRLAKEIGEQLGVSLMRVDHERFPDGELLVRLCEPVRGRWAIIVQPTGPPVDENLVELLALADACRRGAADRVVAVVPYFGYARGDRRAGAGTPIMASLTAALIERAGVDQLLTVDLHAPQIEGFFGIPIEDLSPTSLLLTALRAVISADTVVVSPDLGRLKLATLYAEHLGTTAAVIHKHRLSGTEARALRVVGEVAGHPCLIVDDMIATGGTIAAAVEALLAAGADADMTVVATHDLLLPGSTAALAHPAVRRVIVTDTLPQPDVSEPARTIVAVAPLLADAIAALRN